MKRTSRRTGIIFLLAVLAATVLHTDVPADPKGEFQLVAPRAAEHVASVTSGQSPLPAEEAASGWPFAQLPMIAKFDVPVPRISITMQPARPVFQHLLTPRRYDVPQVPAGGNSSVWLLTPLAAGAFLGSAEGTPPAENVVPEPATLLLLCTGLLLLGLVVRLRAA